MAQYFSFRNWNKTNLCVYKWHINPIIAIQIHEAFSKICNFNGDKFYSPIEDDVFFVVHLIHKSLCPGEGNDGERSQPLNGALFVQFQFDLSYKSCLEEIWQLLVRDAFRIQEHWIKLITNDIRLSILFANFSWMLAVVLLKGDNEI